MKKKEIPSCKYLGGYLKISILVISDHLEWRSAYLGTYPFRYSDGNVVSKNELVQVQVQDF